MDDEKLRNLLGLPTATTEQRVLIKIRASLARLQAANPGRSELVMPQVTYDLVGRVAGQATSRNVIRLNTDLLRSEYVEHMLHTTVPHEVAHIAEYQWCGVAGHGPPWEKLMWQLGLPANRTHDMPVKPARVHQKVTVYCACGPKQMGMTRYRRMFVERTNTYRCTRCGETVREQREVTH
jgi:predicted SprT family Zn-dependent metalloprotease